MTGLYLEGIIVLKENGGKSVCLDLSVSFNANFFILTIVDSFKLSLEMPRNKAQDGKDKVSGTSQHL